MNDKPGVGPGVLAWVLAAAVLSLLLLVLVVREVAR